MSIKTGTILLFSDSQITFRFKNATETDHKLTSSVESSLSGRGINYGYRLKCEPVHSIEKPKDEHGAPRELVSSASYPVQSWYVFGRVNAAIYIVIKSGSCYARTA